MKCPAYDPPPIGIYPGEEETDNMLLRQVIEWLLALHASSTLDDATAKRAYNLAHDLECIERGEQPDSNDAK